jgi:hypothetical protein
MTKQEQQIAKLIRDLDLEKHKRIQAERQASALRMVIGRLTRKVLGQDMGRRRKST